MTLKQKILSGELALSAKGDTKKVCDAFNYVFECGVLYGDFARLNSIEKPLQFYFDEKIGNWSYNCKEIEKMLECTFDQVLEEIEKLQSDASNSVKNVRKEIYELYQGLFNFFDSEHNLLLTISDMDEIVNQCDKFKKQYNEYFKELSDKEK